MSGGGFACRFTTAPAHPPPGPLSEVGDVRAGAAALVGEVENVVAAEHVEDEIDGGWPVGDEFAGVPQRVDLGAGGPADLGDFVVGDRQRAQVDGREIGGAQEVKVVEAVAEVEGEARARAGQVDARTPRVRRRERWIRPR